MTKWRFEEKKWVLIGTMVVLMLAAASYQESIGEHMYPQDALHDASNLSVRGIVTSIEENHEVQGFGFDSYHIFRFYIRLNMTDVVWVTEDLEWVFPTGNNTVNYGKRLVVGYDDFVNPRLSLGQGVECKGYISFAMDSPWTFALAVEPSVTGSYLHSLLTSAQSTGI